MELMIKIICVGVYFLVGCKIGEWIAGVRR